MNNDFKIISMKSITVTNSEIVSFQDIEKRRMI